MINTMQNAMDPEIESKFNDASQIRARCIFCSRRLVESIFVDLIFGIWSMLV